MYMSDLLPLAYKARRNVCFCALGAVGIGKTAELFDFAKEMGVNYEEINVSQMAFNEVAGMTMPDESSHSMKIYDYERLTRLKDGDILFLDELLTGSEQTLSALLKLIEDRTLISGRKLADIMIIAAANPIASPTMLPLSIRQRFQFVNIDWNSKKWREYIKSTYNVNVPESVIKIITDELSRANDNNANWNVLSPRTATKLLDFYQSNVDSDFDISTIYGDLLFGSGRHADFFDWVMKARQVDDARKQLIDCIKEYYSDKGMVMPNAINNLNDSELLPYLQSLPDWSQLVKVLDVAIRSKETITSDNDIEF